MISHLAPAPHDTRRVYLEPTWNLHGFQYQMISPPTGYEFISAEFPGRLLLGGGAPSGSACVAALTAAAALLIARPGMRRKLGRAARHEVEQGTFSLAKMNGRLAQRFDIAVAGVAL